MFALDMLKKNTVVVYGAGGVAGQLICLLGDKMADCRVAVSQKPAAPAELQGFKIYGIEELMDYRQTAVVVIATTPSYQTEIKTYLEEVEFRNIYTVDEVMDCVYAELYRQPIASNKVLFSNFHGRGYGCNPKYIAEELRKYENLDLVWAVSSEDACFPEGIRAVKHGSYEHYRELATARVWVDNQHKDYLTRKRPGQYYIQTWHGCGPLKKIEYDADTLPVSYMETLDRDVAMTDLCLSGILFTTEQYRRAFRYNGEIAEYGCPRNDIFFRDEQYDRYNTILKRLGIDGNKRIVLYAPTFRNNLKAVEELDYDRVVRTLQNRDGREYIVLVRQHPDIHSSGRDNRGRKDILDVSEYDDIQELLYVSDILITDYSSVMWDFSLQKKPVFLFHTDVDSYDKERGFYLPFSSYPYLEVSSNDELEETMMKYDEKSYIADLESFFSEYKPFDNGSASQKVAARICEVIRNGK